MHVFEDKLQRLWPPSTWETVPTVIGVSGGADSVALLTAARQLSSHPANLHVAHFNHGWRGGESDADEQFVTQLCHRLDVSCHIGHPQGRSTPSEDAARSARYAFFNNIIQKTGARLLATAHTRNDQVETILMRILRGTAVRGLAGIPRARPIMDNCAAIVRPLLEFDRQELTDYLHAVGQAHRNDSSNLDPTYRRNQIRHELLPLLREQYNQNVDEALLRLGRVAADVNQHMDEVVASLPQITEAVEPDRVVCLLTPLKDQFAFVISEFFLRLWKRQQWPLQAMGHNEWEQLVSLVHGDRSEPAITLPGGIRAEKTARELIFTRGG